jgi:hypothetical protein
MLKKPVAAAVVLGLLACCAAVGLESVGLLFHASLPDPEQRMDAFVARLEADLSPVDLPTEPVELPHEVAEGLPGGSDDVDDAAETPGESPRQAGLDGRGEERLVLAFTSPPPMSLPESAAQPDEVVVPGEAVAPMAPEALEPAPAPLPAAQASGPAPAAAPTTPRATGARRTRSALGPTGYAAFGWPVLDWLPL